MAVGLTRIGGDITGFGKPAHGEAVFHSLTLGRMGGGLCEVWGAVWRGRRALKGGCEPGRCESGRHRSLHACSVLPAGPGTLYVSAQPLLSCSYEHRLIVPIFQVETLRFRKRETHSAPWRRSQDLS